MKLNNNQRNNLPYGALSLEEMKEQYQEYLNGKRELDKYIIRGMAEYPELGLEDELCNLGDKTKNVTDLSFCFDGLNSFNPLKQKDKSVIFLVLSPKLYNSSSKSNIGYSAIPLIIYLSNSLFPSRYS